MLATSTLGEFLRRLDNVSRSDIGEFRVAKKPGLFS